MSQYVYASCSMLMKTEACDNIKTEHQEVGWGSMDCMSWLRIGTGGGNYKRGNEHSRAIK